MKYEDIKKTPTLNRIEQISDNLVGIGANQIRKLRPGVNQRRQLLCDILNDERFDGEFIKSLV